MKELKKQIRTSIPSLAPFVEDDQNKIHFNENYNGYVKNLMFALENYYDNLIDLGIDLTSLETISISSKNINHKLAEFVYLNSSQVFAHNIFWEKLNNINLNKKFDETAKLRINIEGDNSMKKSYFASKAWDIGLQNKFRNPGNFELQTISDLERLKRELLIGAASVVGSGWLWVVLNEFEELEVLPMYSVHNPLSITKAKILLGIDLWEHAYYKKYHNDKETYVKNLFNLIDWDIIIREARMV